MDNKRVIELMDSLKAWLQMMSSMGYSVQEIDEAIINVLNNEEPEDEEISITIHNSRG